MNWLLCLIFTAVVVAQEAAPTAQDLSAFETFVSQPSSRVTATKHVGRIESAFATAVLSVVTVEDALQNRTMRGIRIEFTRNRTKDVVYVEQKLVDRLGDSLLEIDELAPRFFARRVGQSSCFGSGMFLDAMRDGAHFVFADSCQELDGFTGVRVNTGAGEFRFSAVDLKRFIGLLDSATAELESR